MMASPPRIPAPFVARCVVYSGILLGCGGLVADTWVDRCTEPTVAWKLGGSQPHVRIIQHDRRHAVDDSEDAEVLRLGCPPGAAAWVWRATPPAAVIDELSIDVTLPLAEAPVGLAAEVVLPRSRDPETGRPERIVVRPATAEGWRRSYPARRVRLSLDGLPAAVERAIRLERLSHQKRRLDGRGAYVVGVGLVVSGYVRPVRVEISQLRLAGRIAPTRRTEQEASPRDDVVSEPSLALADLGGEQTPTTVELTASGWRVDGREFFVRGRVWRGESAEHLLSLGFNTLWFEAPPTATDASAFAARGLRLICPCPDDPSSLGDATSAVLAWTLPETLDGKRLDSGLARVERLRSLPAAYQRPILGRVAEAHGEWSRVLDGVVVDPTSGSMMALDHQSDAVARAARLVTPGTPLLALAPLDVDGQVRDQLDALLGDGVASAWVSPSSVPNFASTAIGTGACGVVFTSDDSLESPEAAAELVGLSVGLTNERLRLLEPWLSAPRQRGGPQEAGSVALERAGARVLLEPSSSAPEEFAAASGPTAVIQRYLLCPAGLRPAAGGEAIDGADLLETGDPRIAQSLARYLAPRRRAAEQRVARLARLSLRETGSLTSDARRKAERLVRDADLARARGDLLGAYLRSCRTLQAIEDAEVARLSIARRAGDASESSPLAVLPGTLTEHFRLKQLLASAPRGPNRLLGGSFEDLDELRRVGWRNDSAAADAPSPVELAVGSPIHGDRRLRLSGGDRAAITSPPTPIRAGEVLEITGWARVGRSEDARGGVIISDDLGGESLAVALGAADTYQQFRLIRAATDDANLRVRFESRGDATIEIDGVMIRPVSLPTSVAETGEPGSRR
ncbi:MAG: hypothetical protein AAFV43_01075 [Planctomycetota bacterium]